MEKKPAPVEVKIADVPTPEQLNQAFLTGDWSDLKVKPKSNCKRCYGRGYEGRNTQTGKLVVCGCIIKQFNKLSRGQKKIEASLEAENVTPPIFSAADVASTKV